MSRPAQKINVSNPNSMEVPKHFLLGIPCNVQICTEKSHMESIPPQGGSGVESLFPQKPFAGYYIIYPDLPKSLVPTPTSWDRVGDGVSSAKKIFGYE